MFRNPTMLFDEVTAALDALLAAWDKPHLPGTPLGGSTLISVDAVARWLVDDMYPAIQHARGVLAQLKQLKDENAASVSWRPRDGVRFPCSRDDE